MKRNLKRNFLFLSTFALAGVSVLALQQGSGTMLFAYTGGSSTEYSLSLDASDINFAGSESTVKTTLQNDITFQHSGLTNSGGFATIAPGGYFMNKEGSLISGVKSLELSFDGDLTIEYAWESTDMLVRAELASDFAYNFRDSSPSYIRIVNESESDVEVTSFDITYSCQPVVKKVIQINYVKKSDSSVLADPTYLILDEGEHYGEEGITGEGAIDDIGGTKWLPNRYWVGGVCDGNKQINITYTEASVYDGTVSTALSGAGTETDPYLISSAADLAYLHNATMGLSETDVYEYGIYSLTTSIYMGPEFDWVGLCNLKLTTTNYAYFSGKILGNGYTIGGLQNTSEYTAIAFISNTKTDCLVENLVLEGAFSTTIGNARIGGAVYWAQNTVFNNVVSYVDVSAAGRYSASLIASCAATSEIKNCESYGTVNSSGINCGGIAGYVAGTVDNCINYGSVSTTGGSGDGCQTAGIAGSTKTATISNCINYGTIYSELSTNNGKGYAGIAGWVTSSTVIYNCGNAGHIYGGTASNAGTIAGYVGKGSKVYGFTSDATPDADHPACYNMVGARYFNNFYPAQEVDTISAIGYYAGTKSKIYDNTGL